MHRRADIVERAVDAEDGKALRWAAVLLFIAAVASLALRVRLGVRPLSVLSVASACLLAALALACRVGPRMIRFVVLGVLVANSAMLVAAASQTHAELGAVIAQSLLLLLAIAGLLIGRPGSLRRRVSVAVGGAVVLPTLAVSAFAPPIVAQAERRCASRVAALATQLNHLPSIQFSLATPVPLPAIMDGMIPDIRGAVLTVDEAGARLEGHSLGRGGIAGLEAALRRIDETWSYLHDGAPQSPVPMYAALSAQLPLAAALPWLSAPRGTRSLALLAIARDVQPPRAPPGVTAFLNMWNATKRDAQDKARLVAGEISRRAAACPPLAKRLSAFATMDKKTLAHFTEIGRAGLAECRCENVDVEALGYLFLLAWNKAGPQIRAVPLHIETNAAARISLPRDATVSDLVARLALLQAGTPVALSLD